MNLKNFKISPSPKHWYEAPPKIIQNIGDGLQSAAIFILAYVGLDNSDRGAGLAIVGIILGALGILIQKIFKV